MRNKIKVTFLLVLMLVIFSTFTYADSKENYENLSTVTQDVEKANYEIDILISQAINEAAILKVKLVNSPDKYQVELLNIIAKLETKTFEIASKAIDKAAQNGIVVYCEWIEVLIDGNSVWIDPLIVGSW